MYIEGLQEEFGDEEESPEIFDGTQPGEFAALGLKEMTLGG